MPGTVPILPLMKYECGAIPDIQRISVYVISEFLYLLLLDYHYYFFWQGINFILLLYSGIFRIRSNFVTSQGNNNVFQIVKLLLENSSNLVTTLFFHVHQNFKIHYQPNIRRYTA
jgi:hypothetical protein